MGGFPEDQAVISGILPQMEDPMALFEYEVDDLTVHQKIELSPGTIVYIPPGTGHRIVNAVVSVLGIPGFKLNNTIFLD